MTNNDIETFLEHHGVLGMKWGVRRNNKNNQEAAYRKKLTAIGKNKSLIGTSDAKRFAYRNQNLAKRVGKNAIVVATGMLFQDLMAGKISGYSNKAELTKKLITFATATAGNMVFNDAMAKSASKRYTDAGKRVKGSKDKIMTKEDWITTVVRTGIAIAPIATRMGALKLSSVAAKKQKNRKIFERWGSNILPQKVSTVLWQSPDMNIIISQGGNYT